MSKPSESEEDETQTKFIDKIPCEIGGNIEILTILKAMIEFHSDLEHDKINNKLKWLIVYKS